MRNALVLIATLVSWLGSTILVIWEWSIWWDAGHTFWVFLSLFTGIGWIPALFMGIAHLFVMNIWLGLGYIGCVWLFLSQR